MSKKKSYEWRDNSYRGGDSDGLKQRRLKEENRWRFNPNQDYKSDDEDEDSYQEFQEEDDERR